MLKLDPHAAFDEDLESVDPFDLGRIHKALEQLQHQAAVRTSNRKDLKRPVPWCPEATSVVRVGEFRVLYRIEEGSVRLLRLGLKTRERLLPVRITKGVRP